MQLCRGAVLNLSAGRYWIRGVLPSFKTRGKYVFPHTLTPIVSDCGEDSRNLEQHHELSKLRQGTVVNANGFAEKGNT